MIAYIAFLRGINLGRRQVSMKELQKVFEKEGFTKVKTFLASGNVIFETNQKNEKVIKEKLEEVLEKRFIFPIPVILRSKEELQQIIKENPFKGAKVVSGMRLHITFFDNQIKSGSPIQGSGFTIMYAGKRELAIVIEPEGKTTELMTYIDKTFGKNSTTRNWNTIQKLI